MSDAGVAFDDWLEGYAVGRERALVAPVQAALEVANATNVGLNTALAGANAEVVRLTAEVVTVSAELAAARRRIAELEAEPQPTRPLLLAAECKPRPGEPSDTGGYVRAWGRMRDGLAQHGGVLGGMHTFSGQAIPSRFGTAGTNGTLLSTPDAMPVVNIKTPGNDLTGARGGKYDAAFIAFLDSWHQERPTQEGWLTIDHEPENPSKAVDPQSFRQAWARYAGLFLAHPISSHVQFAACFMGWTWQPASGRTPDQWNPLPLLTPAEQDRVVLAADIYFKSTETADKGWTDSARPFFDYCQERGYRTAVFETALNNDANRPAAECAAILRELGARYKAVDSLEMVAYYEATGPAAGTNAWIDSPEEYAALATWS